MYLSSLKKIVSIGFISGFISNAFALPSLQENHGLRVTCSNSYYIIATTNLSYRKSCDPNCIFELNTNDNLELGYTPGFGTWTYHYIPAVKLVNVSENLFQYGTYENSQWVFREVENSEGFQFNLGFDYTTAKCEVHNI